MPTYEFRCRTCDTTFELKRSMAAASEPASCPDGHADTVKLLSRFASVGVGASSAAGPAPSAGAPCGAACGCHPH